MKPCQGLFRCFSPSLPLHRLAQRRTLLECSHTLNGNISRLWNTQLWFQNQIKHCCWDFFFFKVWLFSPSAAIVLYIPGGWDCLILLMLMLALYSEYKASRHTRRCTFITRRPLFWPLLVFIWSMVDHPGLNGMFVPTTPAGYALTWWTDVNGLPAGRRLHREECGALQYLWSPQHLCEA